MTLIRSDFNFDLCIEKPGPGVLCFSANSAVFATLTNSRTHRLRKVLLDGQQRVFVMDSEGSEILHQ